MNINMVQFTNICALHLGIFVKAIAVEHQKDLLVLRNTSKAAEVRDHTTEFGGLFQRQQDTHVVVGKMGIVLLSGDLPV